MSEQTPAPATGAVNNPPATPPAVPQPTTTAEPPQGVSPEAWAALGDPGKAAITAEREARATAERSAAALQAQLDEIARANLSDLERAQQEARDAQEAAATATTEALRFRLAAEHGISREDAEMFLTGNDEPSMSAQAARLAAKNASAPRTPAPDPTQGGTGTPPGSTPEGDFQNFLSKQLGARA